MDDIKIVTICGCPRFKEKIDEIERLLTLTGHIALKCPFDNIEINGEFDEEERCMLATLHLAKIKMSHAIYVIKMHGYITEDMYREIEYAKRNNIEIIYMEGANVTNTY